MAAFSYFAASERLKRLPVRFGRKGGIIIIAAISGLSDNGVMARKPTSSSLKAVTPRVIALLAVENAQILDVVGPLEVFGTANRFLMANGLVRSPAYILHILAERAGPLTTSGGLQIVANRAIGGKKEAIDTFLIAGGQGIPQARKSQRLTRWIARTAESARRVASVCS